MCMCVLGGHWWRYIQYVVCRKDMCVCVVLVGKKSTHDIYCTAGN